MPRRPWSSVICSLAVAVGLTAPASSADLGEVPRFHVIEISFEGPSLGPADTPARDIELAAVFRRESDDREWSASGFWDGDGAGGRFGSVFRVRFSPQDTGRWTLVRVRSNRPRLAGQREGDTFTCTASAHPGLWIADGRWYGRSDGSHGYIVGNTHYTFLSRRTDRGEATTHPVEDIRANSAYFRKLRFSLLGGRYPDPGLKPFLDDSGRASDDGRYSYRPNPSWFHERVDPVVREGFRQDLICDLILAGPDTREARSTLAVDPVPWLRYVAARYGAYVNVWFCLANEWDIKNPSYSAREIASAGRALVGSLTGRRPISVHGKPGTWNRELNGDWHDHVIIQHKLKRLDRAADVVEPSYRSAGGKPVLNDENAYEGAGDRFSEGDVIEGCLGTFLGGGYPTTGHKPASKKGHYFWGGFDPAEHHAADNLQYLRKTIDESMAFWTLEPMPIDTAFITGAPESSRLLGQKGEEYVLGSDRRADGVVIRLPAGPWRIVQSDIMAMRTRTFAERASGELKIDLPESRAVITHLRRVEE